MEVERLKAKLEDAARAAGGGAKKTVATRMPAELWRRVRVAAAESGVTVEAWLEGVVIRALKATAESKVATSRSDSSPFSAREEAEIVRLSQRAQDDPGIAGGPCT